MKVERDWQEARRAAAGELARNLIQFADGAEEGGLIVYARRARVVAYETIWLAEQLRCEQLLRQRMQEQRDIALDALMARALRQHLQKPEPPEEKIAL